MGKLLISASDDSQIPHLTYILSFFSDWKFALFSLTEIYFVCSICEMIHLYWKTIIKLSILSKTNTWLLLLIMMMFSNAIEDIYMKWKHYPINDNALHNTSTIYLYTYTYIHIINKMTNLKHAVITFMSQD